MYTVSVHNCNVFSTLTVQLADLFIEENVDNWVVDCRGLGKDGWYWCKSQVESLSAVIHDPQRKNGVRCPAHQEAQHHDDHHPGHLPLCLLGGGRLSLGLCCLLSERSIKRLMTSGFCMFSGRCTGDATLLMPLVQHISSTITLWFTPCWAGMTQSLDFSGGLPHHFQCDEQLSVAEYDGG